MKVTTVRLPEEVLEQLETEAAEHGFSNRTEYIREILKHRDAVRESIGSRENTEQYEDLRERLADLEARVEDLEAGGGGVDREPRPAVEPGGGDRDAGGSEAVREAVLDELGEAKKTHVREAVADAVALLVERGPLSTGEVKTELWSAYDDHYSTEKGMWESVNRYVKDVDGVSKPGYGEWDAER
jgi:metal-responsive CopG/Arc/MetJ family transcriptional regulator